MSLIKEVDDIRWHACCAHCSDFSR